MEDRCGDKALQKSSPQKPCGKRSSSNGHTILWRSAQVHALELKTSCSDLRVAFRAQECCVGCEIAGISPSSRQIWQATRAFGASQSCPEPSMQCFEGAQSVLAAARSYRSAVPRGSRKHLTQGGEDNWTSRPPKLFGTIKSAPSHGRHVNGALFRFIYLFPY